MKNRHQYIIEVVEISEAKWPWAKLLDESNQAIPRTLASRTAKKKKKKPKNIKELPIFINVYCLW